MNLLVSLIAEFANVKNVFEPDCYRSLHLYNLNMLFQRDFCSLCSVQEETSVNLLSVIKCSFAFDPSPSAFLQ
jgi:hypothetical protein